MAGGVRAAEPLVGATFLNATAETVAGGLKGLTADVEASSTALVTSATARWKSPLLV